VSAGETSNCIMFEHRGMILAYLRIRKRAGRELRLDDNCPDDVIYATGRRIKRFRKIDNRITVTV